MTEGDFQFKKAHYHNELFYLGFCGYYWPLSKRLCKVEVDKGLFWVMFIGV